MMFRLRRRPATLPPRRDGEPLRDGDTVLYPGHRRAAEAIADDEPLAGGLPAWCHPTMALPQADTPAPGRRYLPS